MRCMYSIFSRDLPYIQSYTVCIHSFGHPYKYVLQLMRVCSGRPSLSVLPLHPKRHCQVSHLHIRAVTVPFILCVCACRTPLLVSVAPAPQTSLLSHLHIRAINVPFILCVCACRTPLLVSVAPAAYLHPKLNCWVTPLVGE